jgi:hypothetical protein
MMSILMAYQVSRVIFWMTVAVLVIDLMMTVSRGISIRRLMPLDASYHASRGNASLSPTEKKELRDEYVQGYRATIGALFIACFAGIVTVLSGENFGGGDYEGRVTIYLIGAFALERITGVYALVLCMMSGHDIKFSR